MSNSIHSISALIDEWDTIGDFATDVGCGYEAARQMRRRNRIAVEHWQSVIEASNRRGLKEISFAWLVEKCASSPVVA